MKQLTKEWAIVIAVAMSCGTWLVTHDGWEYSDAKFSELGDVLEIRTHKITGKAEVFTPTHGWMSTETVAEVLMTAKTRAQTKRDSTLNARGGK